MRNGVRDQGEAQYLRVLMIAARSSRLYQWSVNHCLLVDTVMLLKALKKKAL